MIRVVMIVLILKKLFELREIKPRFDELFPLIKCTCLLNKKFYFYIYWFEKFTSNSLKAAQCHFSNLHGFQEKFANIV